MFGTFRSGGRRVRAYRASHCGRARACGAYRSMVARSIRCGIFGLPQSRPVSNVQSRVMISPTAPAARARSTRASISARPPIQYTWKNVLGLAAATSSTGLLPNELRPTARPRFAAARATAASPSGCTACTPVGERITGMDTGWPSTVVARSRCLANPATCGANPSSPNAATLSASVAPCSDPATTDQYTDFGNRFLARRSASATVSSHPLPIAVLPGLLDHLAGVDGQRDAGDVPGLVGGQEQDRVGDVRRLDPRDRQGVQVLEPGGQHLPGPLGRR